MLTANEKQKDTYIAWLNDAHAMEEGLIKVLERQVEDTEGQPLMQERIKEHLEETRRHAEMVRGCVERLGGDISQGKDILSQMGAAAKGMTLSMFEDKHVKNVLSSYSAEHVEIASYHTIMAAAQALGDHDTVAMCETIMRDEERMAAWLMDQMPLVAQRHLNTLGQVRGQKIPNLGAHTRAHR
ncbi:MAG TPA: DUF892 family protein [Candidatus Paceibacterota bacterium]|nr:DUF892 family protein [Candidatus Paceibacterota bacterium]